MGSWGYFTLLLLGLNLHLLTGFLGLVYFLNLNDQGIFGGFPYCKPHFGVTTRREQVVMPRWQKSIGLKRFEAKEDPNKNQPFPPIVL